MTVKYRRPRTISTQGSMFPEVMEKVVGDNRDKIWHLFQQEPEISNDDALLQLLYWVEFDGLEAALGSAYGGFIEWYLHKATNAESLRRSRQSMTEHGILPERTSVKKRRAWRAEVWRKYWGPYR